MHIIGAFGDLVWSQVFTFPMNLVGVVPYLLVHILNPVKYLIYIFIKQCIMF